MTTTKKKAPAKKKAAVKKKKITKKKTKKKAVPKVKKKNGRPTIVTPEVVAKLEQAFEWGCSDIESCLHSGISKDALYDYQLRTPGFADRKRILKETPTIRARRSVVNALGYDHEFALKYLERKKKAEFSTRSEISNAEGESFVIENLDPGTLSDIVKSTIDIGKIKIKAPIKPDES